jgi:thiol:disulfide interchange protein DsbD
MKKVFGIVSIVTILYSGALTWSHNFEKSLEQAQTSHKPILMMYHAEWCPECGYMKEVIFKDPHLSEYMKKHFQLLSFDVSKDKLPKGYHYKGVPTFFIISGDKKLLGTIEGASSAEAFLKKLKAYR